ncbi:hypothetical protein BDZ94DRAFT_114522 [Collybia nuda]|uniref:F-box domain-containing protein n=1 Tax=Collybia nuda TaxID=64659 RepID=A0A9P5XZ36_9AGAR|nr:hypothetical protein BDZ94DRAFT_114522 [Collybia nuda]
MDSQTNETTIPDASVELHGVIRESMMDTRFPNEILSEFFIASTPSPLKVPPPLRDTDLPWALLRVCKKWREVALKTPDLWNNVLLDYDEGSDMFISTNMYERTLSAEKILKRTKHTSISLKIKALGFYSIDEWQSRIFNLIISESLRIKSLTVHINISHLDPFLRLEQIPFPRLEYLSIDDGHGINAIDMSGNIPSLLPSYEVTIWKNTPSLRSFYLGTNISWKNNVTSISWAQLTDITLRVTRLPIVEAHTMLRLCPNIVSLKITPGVLGNQNTAPVDEPVNLPNLTKLIAEFYCSNELSIFLQPLVAPHLRNLSTRYPTFVYEELEWNSSLVDILARFTRLESLSFRDRAPINNIPALLAALPSLKALMLPNRAALSQVDLTGISQGSLLPDLEILCCTIRPGSLKMHLEMLREREKSSGGSKKVFAILNWYIDDQVDSSREQTSIMEENAELIEELQRDGLLDLPPPGSVYSFSGGRIN